MKPFHDVQKDRQARLEPGRTPTVHRSSLLAPKMERAATQISFLNHFLIKRGIEKLTCKVSAIDSAGLFAGAASFLVDAPAAYVVDLERYFPDRADIGQYMIEFYSDDNLVVSYPAVMVNHRGEDFLNVVHSYNRVINDVFEDEQVNRISVSESSIEAVDEAPYSTFFTFCAGPLGTGGELELVRSDDGHETATRLTLSPGRLGLQTVLLPDHVPDSALKPSTVLKITQPRQALFYGRMLAGIMNRETRAFSGNHSYYDSSKVAEYFDNDRSARTYPYFAGFLNAITLYPIMSPGRYELCVRVFGPDGDYAGAPALVISPGGSPISVSIDALVQAANLGDCTAFEVMVRALDGGKIPTRVMHQLIYGDAAGRSRLNSSVAIGLINASVSKVAGKAGMCWGQMVLDPAYQSRAAIGFDRADGDPADVSVEFYSTQGLFHEQSKRLHPGENMIFGEDDLPDPGDGAGLVWYAARSERADLSGQSFHVHRGSGNASGEHSF